MKCTVEHNTKRSVFTLALIVLMYAFHGFFSRDPNLGCCMFGASLSQFCIDHFFLYLKRRKQPKIRFEVHVSPNGYDTAFNIKRVTTESQ